MAKEQEGFLEGLLKGAILMNVWHEESRESPKSPGYAAGNFIAAQFNPFSYIGLGLDFVKGNYFK